MMSSITNNISSDDISRMLHGHTHFVIYVVQLADGRLVSAGDDHKLKIWNILCLYPSRNGYEDDFLYFFLKLLRFLVSRLNQH